MLMRELLPVFAARWLRVGSAVLLALAMQAALAQLPGPVLQEVPVPVGGRADRAPALVVESPLAPNAEAAAPTGLSAGQIRFRTAALVIATVGGTAAYGRAKWWQDGFSGSFKTVNEGWFGRDTNYGGADKLGHAMFAHTGSRLLARAFEWAGNEPDKALRLGLWTAVGTLMGVEVFDAYSKKWRFSREDAIANLAGGALAYWLETQPAVDALLDFRIQYSPSTGADGRREFDPFGDYSGQRYLLVLKANGVAQWREQPLLRYLEFSVGYGTRNFETESRALAAPTRHAYYGVSLNLSELLRSTVFRGNARASGTQRLTETFLEFVQIPAVSVQADHVIR